MAAEMSSYRITFLPSDSGFSGGCGGSEPSRTLTSSAPNASTSRARRRRHRDVVAQPRPRCGVAHRVFLQSVLDPLFESLNWDEDATAYAQARDRAGARKLGDRGP